MKTAVVRRSKSIGAISAQPPKPVARAALAVRTPATPAAAAVPPTTSVAIISLLIRLCAPIALPPKFPPPSDSNRPLIDVPTILEISTAIAQIINERLTSIIVMISFGKVFLIP